MPFSIHRYRRLPLTFFSGFWSLIVFIVLSSDPVYAEWVKITSSDGSGGHTRYVDPNSVRRKGKLVKIWELNDYYKTQPVSAGKLYLSVKHLEEYDCEAEQSRTLAFYWYSGQMGNGDVVLFDSDPDKWSPVMPGSVGQAMWKAACGKQ